MNILYLYGLDSHLQDDRRDVLNNYGNIHAPKLNYLENNHLLEELTEKYQQINAIVGSSAGGLVGYFLAQKLEKPCLLFNPALPYKDKFKININKIHTQYTQVVLGTKDEIIPYKNTLKILENELIILQKLEIHLIVGLGHSYGIEIFRQEVEFFFKKIRA